MIPTIFKALLYTLLLFVFGLSQLWFLIGNSMILNNYTFDYNHIWMTGLISFFSSAIASTIILDYYFFSRIKILSKKASSFLFVIFPMVIIIVCVWLVSMCFGENESNLNKDVLEGIQLTIVTMTFVSGVVSKIIMSQDDISEK